MTVQTFRDLMAERPFQPFRLVMSSGEKYDVTHPELAIVMKSDILVAYEQDEDEGVPTRFKVCSMLHVTAIEPLPAATSGNESENGAPRR